LKVFFAFLLSSGIIKDNPMTRIKVEKLDYANGANQTKWLTKEEQDRFISYVQLEPNEFKRLRNLAIIDLMLYSGLRVNEVSSLEINDIITKDKDVQVIIPEGVKADYFFPKIAGLKFPRRTSWILLFFFLEPLFP
jgi:integrase/recombinase XerC